MSNLGQLNCVISLPQKLHHPRNFFIQKIIPVSSQLPKSPHFFSKNTNKTRKEKTRTRVHKKIQNSKAKEKVSNTEKKRESFESSRAALDNATIQGHSIFIPYATPILFYFPFHVDILSHIHTCARYARQQQKRNNMKMMKKKLRSIFLCCLCP